VNASALGSFRETSQASERDWTHEASSPANNLMICSFENSPDTNGELSFLSAESTVYLVLLCRTRRISLICKLLFFKYTF
jgi:hypothetical protein